MFLRFSANRGPLLLALVVLCCTTGGYAQQWGQLQGRVVQKDSRTPVEGATILVAGTNFGTATSESGHYNLRLPAGSYQLRISSIGYSTQYDSVRIADDDTTRTTYELVVQRVEMEEVTIEARPTYRLGVHVIEPEDIENIPMPLQDSYRAMKLAPGVATNNELSGNYSVRGGGYNENLVLINGFQIYRPFRIHQGEQEGLGLLNAALTRQMEFYTGGFPSRFGGKLSSALVARYEAPTNQPPKGSIYISSLDAGAHAAGSSINNTLGWTIGVRKARPGRFFATQELKGNYDPDFTDAQGLLTIRPTPHHSIQLLGIWARHRFRLRPEQRKTYFGTLGAGNNFRSVWISYDEDSRETDGYNTRFGGVIFKNRITSRLQAEHRLGYYQTREWEEYQLTGGVQIFEILQPGEIDPDTPAGHDLSGTATRTDVGNNRINVNTATGRGRWILEVPQHTVEAGWFVRQFQFSDRLSEYAIIHTQTENGSPLNVTGDSLVAQNSLSTRRIGGYIQDEIAVLPSPNRLTVRPGVRLSQYRFNGQWTVSPRLRIGYDASDNTRVSAGTGVYHQPPGYREIRGDPPLEKQERQTLNPRLRAQQAIQAVVGIDHFFPVYRLNLRVEAYYKKLNDLISYRFDRVRTVYSGRNDSRGRTYGFDLQLQGQLVPGLKSWINYGFLVTRENFFPEFTTPYRKGWLSRPTDQRHTFSAFIQDYIPGDKSWKLHLRLLFGTGLPYTPPRPEETEEGYTVQVPGHRMSDRYPEYKRVDIGATKVIDLADQSFDEDNPVQLELTAEILNLFDMVNTIDYTWIADHSGRWQRIPTHLTPRTLNVRLRLDF